MKISEHANYLLNEFGRLQFDYAVYCKPNGESLRNEARNNLETYIAELEHDLANKEIEYTDLWNDALALQSRIAELEAAHRWISVSERLPEENVAVLVVTKRNRNPVVAWMRLGLWRSRGVDFALSVTHWMPLPELPEVQE